MSVCICEPSWPNLDETGSGWDLPVEVLLSLLLLDLQSKARAQDSLRNAHKTHKHAGHSQTITLSHYHTIIW